MIMVVAGRGTGQCISKKNVVLSQGRNGVASRGSAKVSAQSGDLSLCRDLGR